MDFVKIGNFCQNSKLLSKFETFVEFLKVVRASASFLCAMSHSLWDTFESCVRRVCVMCQSCEYSRVIKSRASCHVSDDMGDPLILYKLRKNTGYCNNLI